MDTKSIAGQVNKLHIGQHINLRNGVKEAKQGDIWERCFDFELLETKDLTAHTFDYRIGSDGVGISVQMRRLK